MPDDINEPTEADAPLTDSQETGASPDAELGGGKGEGTAEPEAPLGTRDTEPPTAPAPPAWAAPAGEHPRPVG
jgi:hypothetical protein